MFRHGGIKHMELPEQYKKNLYRMGLVFLAVISIYYAVRSVSEWRSYDMMGKSYSTISVSGHGEVDAVPDIANVSFTITKEAKTVKDAQAGVAEVEKKALDFLKEQKIDIKDIKTSYASFYPKYDYKRAICPASPLVASDSSGSAGVSTYFCGVGKQVLVGYEASESITVKVRDTDKVGAIMQGLGALGVTNLSGPNFAIDKEDSLKAEARKKAINDAKKKAEILAKDLGVSLDRISSFSESDNYAPMYDRTYMAKSSIAESSAPAEIPKGQNTISSDVMITYEIR